MEVKSSLDKKLDKLCQWLSQQQQIAVAFSGGCDSSLLLYAAHKALGQQAFGLIANSELLPSGRLDVARRFAHEVGVRLEEVQLTPLAFDGFAQNSENRCYICKKQTYQTFLHTIPTGCLLVDGSNLDDLAKHRPGRRAIIELAVATPLVDIGFSKKEIRRISKKEGLSSWQLPADSCLATRIATGKKILRNQLSEIDKVESFLIKSGCSGVRVAIDGQTVYLQVQQGDGKRILSQGLAQKLLEQFAPQKFTKVFLDLSERPGIVF